MSDRVDTLLCQRDRVDTLLCQRETVDTLLCQRETVDTLLCQRILSCVRERESWGPGTACSVLTALGVAGLPGLAPSGGAHLCRLPAGLS